MGEASRDGVTLRTRVLICLAIALGSASVWLLNVTAYPSFNDFFPQARDIATAFSGLCALVCAFLAARRPRAFLRPVAFAASIAMLAVGSAGMFVGSWLESGVLAALFACVRSLGGLLCFIYTGFALIRLQPRQCVAMLMVAYLGKYALIGLLVLLPPILLPALFLAFQVASLWLTYACARPLMRSVGASDSQADLSVTNPLSFLPITSGLFVAIMLFQGALGFAITYGSVESFPQPTMLAVVAMAVVAVLALVRRDVSLDLFYAAAFVLVLAGLLVVPGVQVGAAQLGALGALVASASNALLQAGSEVINVAVWLLAAAVGRRNLVGALPAMFVINAAGSIGVELGAASGNLQNLLSEGYPDLAVLFPIAISFAFAVYNFFLARSFSFDATVRALQPVVEVQQVAEEGPAGASRIDQRCRELAEANHLTERESQVLALLARGRNAAYIQESLSLSRNTIKSYVARVYGKLGVHSHQEVIDLVEQGLETDGR